MFENPYTQTLQDQLGQFSRMLSAQTAAVPEVAPALSRFDYVDGLEGAKAILGKMLPSTKHIVWDSEKPVFYVLQKDANGSASRVQICTFTVELEPTMEEKYVSREDFNALVSKLDQLLNKEVKDNG